VISNWLKQGMTTDARPGGVGCGAHGRGPRPAGELGQGCNPNTLIRTGGAINGSEQRGTWSVYEDRYARPECECSTVRRARASGWMDEEATRRPRCCVSYRNANKQRAGLITDQSRSNAALRGPGS
jgi:hypothetical protein